MTIITSPHFDLIYIPVLILCAGLFIFSGLRQKYAVSTVAGLTVFLMVLFVTGLKLISYPISEWNTIFSQSTIELHHTKYLPGGIIFIVLGLVVLKFVLKIRISILDSLILGLPLIGILQRIDCLLSGCCYGIPTQLPWAIHYTSNSASYKQQVSQGLIPETATETVGIHPTQLYYIMGFILVFALLITFRKRLKASGSLALFGFILMAVSRFSIEFFREPVENKLSSIQWAGVNLLQWIILGLILISVVLLYYREKRYKEAESTPKPHKEYLFRSSLVLFVATVLVWNFSRVLDYPEFIFLQVLIAVSIAVVVVRLLQKSTVPALRYATLATMFLTIVFMSQKSTDTIISNDSIIKPHTWWDVKASIGGGNYDQINYDCNGKETSRTPQHYTIFSGGFAYNNINKQHDHLQLGLNLGRLYDTGDLLGGQSSSDQMNNLSINYISPYFKYDFHKVGFGFGYNFLLPQGTQGLPILYFRAFPREKVFLDMNVGDNFYTSGISGVWQIGMGTGFGDPEKHILRFGFSSVENKVLGYADGEFLVHNRLYVHTTLDIGNKIHGMLGLKYQVGKNR